VAIPLMQHTGAEYAEQEVASIEHLVIARLTSLRITAITTSSTKGMCSPTKMLSETVYQHCRYLRGTFLDDV
jgi:hypothetical protein